MLSNDNISGNDFFAILDLNGTRDEVLPPATVDANRSVMEPFAKKYRGRPHRRIPSLLVHPGQHQGRGFDVDALHRVGVFRLTFRQIVWTRCRANDRSKIR
jgi:hypothetical protein